MAFLALFLISMALFAESGWKRVKNSNGIQVYTRSVAGSDLDEFKGITVVDARIEVIGEVIRDVPAQSQWMADCLEGRIIKKFSDNDMLVYNVTDVPWPLDDRDVLVRSRGKIDMAKGVVDVVFTSVTDASVPPKKGRVRMKDFYGRWLLERVDTEKTRVTYIIKANPGGSIPASVANLSSKKIPYETLKNLKKMAKKQKYVNMAKKKYKF